MSRTAEARGSVGVTVRRARSRTMPMIIAMAIGLWAASAAHAQERTPAGEAAAYVRPAVVYIETHWSAYVQDHYGDWLNGGDPYMWTSRCSGFVVNPSGYVVTAGHCVDDSLEGARGTAISYGIEEYILSDWVEDYDWSNLAQLAYANWTVEGEGAGTPPDRQVYVQHGEAAAGLTTGKAWPARVVEVRELSKGDVALLKVEESELPSVLVAQDSDISIGTEVLAVGYPASSDEVTDATYEPTYKDGTVSSKKTREDGLLPVYEISAAVSGGMSGGPTVTLDGDVVGVNSFKISGEEQQFNFLSPASLVTEMLSRNGVANELGRVDELYREGLDSFFAGDYQAARVSFDDVLDRAPSHQQAQEFRAEAVRLADAQGATDDDPAADDAEQPTRTLPVPLPVLIGAIALLAVGGGGAAWAFRRRSRTAPAPVAPEVATPTSTDAGGAPVPPAFTGVDGQTVTPAETERDAPQRVTDVLRAAVTSEVTAADGRPDGTTTSDSEDPEVGVGFCTNCGSPVFPDARFCGSCGRPVTDDVSLHP